VKSEFAEISSAIPRNRQKELLKQRQPIIIHGMSTRHEDRLAAFYIYNGLSQGYGVQLRTRTYADLLMRLLDEVIYYHNYHLAVRLYRLYQTRINNELQEYPSAIASIIAEYAVDDPRYLTHEEFLFDSYFNPDFTMKTDFIPHRTLRPVAVPFSSDRMIRIYEGVPRLLMFVDFFAHHIAVWLHDIETNLIADDLYLLRDEMSVLHLLQNRYRFRACYFQKGHVQSFITIGFLGWVPPFPGRLNKFYLRDGAPRNERMIIPTRLLKYSPRRELQYKSS